MLTYISIMYIIFVFCCHMMQEDLGVFAVVECYAVVRAELD